MYTWSFSSLKQFNNCPRQYHEVKVLKNYETKVTEQMLYGTEVHKALEDYVKDGTPLLKNYERFQKVLDELLAIPGKRYPEHKMALDVDKNRCTFDDGYWVRGIADLLIVDDEQAFVVDYKTGSAKYPDPKQLKLMALMVFVHFPQVKEVHGALLFVLKDVVVTESYKSDEVEQLWQTFYPDLARLEIAYNTNRWMPNPTPLCGWCPVKSCEFHKER